MSPDEADILYQQHLMRLEVEVACFAQAETLQPNVALQL